MKRNDIIAAGIFIALGIFIFTQTLTFPSLDKDHPGPALFPNILAVLFIAFGIGLILKARKVTPSPSSAKEGGGGLKNLSNALFVLVIVAVFVAVVNFIGFLITSAVLLFLLMKKLGVTLLKSAMASLLITLFINFMFSKVLRVPLPYGILGW